MKRLLSIFISLLIISFSLLQFKPVYAGEFTIYYHNYYYDKADVYSKGYPDYYLSYGLVTPDPISYEVSGKVFSFSGWYSDAELTNQFIGDASKGDFVNGELHLYGKWENFISISGKITIEGNDNYVFGNKADIYFSNPSTYKKYEFENINADGTYSAYVSPNINIELSFKYNFPYITTSEYKLNVGETNLTDVNFTIARFNRTTSDYDELYEGLILPPKFILTYPWDGYDYSFIFNGTKINLNSLYDDYLNFPDKFGVTNDKLIKVSNINNQEITFETVDDAYYNFTDLENGKVLHKGDYLYVNEHLTYRIYSEFSDYIEDKNTGNYDHSTVFSQTSDPILVQIHKDCFVGDFIINDSGGGSYTYYLNVIEHEKSDDVSYCWTSDFAKCAALKDIIKNEKDFVTYEIVNSNFNDTTPATNFNNVSGYYSASFKTNGFITQNSSQMEIQGTIIDPGQFMVNDSLDWNEDGRLYSIMTNCIYQDGVNFTITCGDTNFSCGFFDTSKDFYFVKNGKYAQLIGQSNAYNKLKTGPNKIDIIFKCNGYDIEYKDSFILVKTPKVNNADLFISIDDKGKYLAYLEGTAYGEKNFTNLSVSYKDNTYTIDLNSDCYLTSKDIDSYELENSIIRTNNGKSLIINGKKHILNLNRSELIKPCDVIYSDNSLTINDITIYYNELDNEYNPTNEYIEKVANSRDKALIKCKNNNLYINDSFIHSNSYNSCLYSYSNNSQIYPASIFISKSSVIHTLIPSYSGEIYSYHSTNNIKLDESSSISLDILQINGDYNFVPSLLKTDYGDLTLENNSSCNYNDINYNNSTFPIDVASNLYVYNSSYISIRYSKLGIIAQNDIIFDDGGCSFFCDYGALVSKNGDIKFIFTNNFEQKFDIDTTETGIYNGIEINAIKVLNNNKNYIFNNSNQNLYIIGQIDDDHTYLFENNSIDKSKFKSIHRSNERPAPTKYDADLVINRYDPKNPNKEPILYVNGQVYPSGAYISWLDVKSSQQDGVYTYTLELDSTVDIYSYNDSCIYTNNGTNLIVTGVGTLCLHADCDGEDDYELYGINCSGKLSFLSYSDTSKPNLVVDFTDEYNSKDTSSYECNPHINAFRAKNGIEINRVSVSSDNYGSMFINDSQTEPFKALNRTSIYHQIFNKNYEYDPLITIDSNDIIFDRSDVYTKAYDFSNQNQIITCLKSDSGTISFDDSRLEFYINKFSNDPTNSFIVSNSNNEDDKISFINSDIEAEGCEKGIYSNNATIDFINTEVEIKSNSSCIETKHLINLQYSPNEYGEVSKIVLNVLNDNCKIVDVEGIDSINLSFNFIDPLPENYDILYSADGDNYVEYNEDDLDEYKFLSMRFNPEPDLTISNNHSTSMYYEGDQFNGPYIDDLYTSYSNNTYTLSTFNQQGITLNSYNSDCITTYNNKSIVFSHNNPFFINVHYDNNVSDQLNAVLSDNNITIGKDDYSDNPRAYNPKIYINYINEQDNSNGYIINHSVNGLVANNNINIYNAIVFSELPATFMSADNGSINIKKSTIIDNIDPIVINTNESMSRFSSIYAKTSISIDDESSLTSRFFNNISDYHNYTILYTQGDIDITDSSLDIEGDVSDYNNHSLEGEKNCFAILSQSNNTITNSDVKINKCDFGLGAANQISIINSDLETDLYGPSLYVVNKIFVQYDDEKEYTFNLKANNNTDYLSVAYFEREDVNPPTSDDFVFDIPENMAIYTDLNKEFKFENYTKYKSLLLKEKEEPIELIYVEAEYPTPTDNGHLPYYDDGNGHYYEDPEGNNPIDDLDKWKNDPEGGGYIKPISKDNNKYGYNEPNNKTFNHTLEEDFTFNSNIDSSKFCFIMLINDKNEQIYIENNYYLSSNKKSVTFKKEFINNLKDGVYTLYFVSTDGYSSSTFTIKRNNPVNPEYNPGYNPGYIIPKTGVK